METTRTIKGYEIRERIGSGGFGVVHRAYQDTVGRDVAIKIILPHFASQPDFIRRFETEAQLIARLEHPYIVPLYDYWRDPEGAYLVMRWLRGGNLRDALVNGPYGLEAAALFLDQITAALALAHRNGIVHRDLKPSNILLDEEGNAYLSDFGIAKDTSKADNSLTGSGIVLGSPDYLSPEQARSEPVTSRTDIYSLGVMVYEVLTGQHPFPNVSSVERMYKHINDPLPLISGLPIKSLDEINAIIQKATAKDPARRYSDVSEIAASFRSAADLSKRSPESIVEQLTLREHEILHLIVDGCSNKDIADRLVITTGTVKWYVRQIFQKLHVRSRVQAIVRARELHLIVPVTSAILTEVGAGEPTYVGLPEPENPYKGLRAFQTADARDFFGRDRLVQRVIKRLGERDKLARFLAVVGPSGSGKSSVVKAGLVPALWRGDLPGADRWFVVEMLPGTHPLDELEVALTRIAASQSGNLREQLERDARGLVRVAGLILPDDGSELLLIVDQFEEVFSLIDQEARRAQFLALLHTAVVDPHSRVRVIITLRADFYDRPLNYADFGELVRSRMETIMPLSADELEQAITRPAARVGVAFEPGLAAAITGDVHYQPGALPLLQYALTELFEQRKDRTLTHEAYRAIGGAIGALTKRAEALYNEQSAAGREALRQMFLRLVTLGEGSENTRRRVMRAELLAVGDNQDVMDEAIDTFAAYRLLTLDHDPATRRPTVEIAHEAILREWERLDVWLNESRQDIQQQRLLAIAADQWQQANRDRSYLLTGARLDQFTGWAVQTKLVLTAGERGFLDASMAEHQHQETAEQTRHLKELQLQRRAANRLRYLVVGLTVFSIITIGLAGLAFDREAKAERQAMVNHSLVLANSAQEANDSGQTELGLRLAMEASTIPGAPPPVERTLRTIAASPGSQAKLNGHTRPVLAVAFSPDGRRAVSGSCAEINNQDGNTCRAGELILWDIQSKTRLRQWRGHTDTIRSVVFSADGRSLWSASQDGTILLWDIDPTSPTYATSVRTMALKLGSVNAIALNADSSTLVAGTGDGSVVLVNPQNGAIIRRLTGHTGSVNSVAVSPDGQTILSGGDDGTVRLWKIVTGELLQQFTGHTNVVHRVLFGPNGSTALSCSMDSTMRQWDVSTGKEVHSFSGFGNIPEIAFRPNSHTVMIDLGTATQVLFDLDSWRISSYLLSDDSASEERVVNAIAFDASGQLALTGARDGSVIVWAMGDDRLVRRFADSKSPDGLLSLAVRPDGRRMLTGTGSTGEMLYWDIDPNSSTYGTVRARLGGFPGMPLVAVFSPDGRSAIIGAGDWAGSSGARKVSLLNLDESSPAFGTSTYTLTGITYLPRSAAFAPDGNAVLLGTQTLTKGEGELALWEVSTGKLYYIANGRDASSILVTPDSKRALTTSSYFSDLVEWNIDLNSPDFGKEIRRIPTHEGTFDLEWGRDGTTFLVAENLPGLSERDYATGKVIRQFQGRTASLWAVALSKDKRYVATGDDLGVVALWDYNTGLELWQSDPQEAHIWNLAFSSDSQHLLSLAPSGQVAEWRASQPSLSELLAWIPPNRFVRDLTCAERTQYGVEPLCPGTP